LPRAWHCINAKAKCIQDIGLQAFCKVMMKNLKCLTCGSNVTAKLQNVFDTRFGIEEVWDICRCTDCGIE